MVAVEKRQQEQQKQPTLLQRLSVTKHPWIRILATITNSPSTDCPDSNPSTPTPTQCVAPVRVHI